MPELTIEEARRVVCEWMEPDAPENGGIPNVEELKKFSPKGWWRYSMLSCNWKQPMLTTCPEIERLGRLWLAEERLSEEQSREYDHLLYISLVENKSKFLYCWHATADQKTLALARVIQGGAK